MSAPKTLEVQLLEPVKELLTKLASQARCHSFEFQLQLLEATASRLGCFSLDDYFKAFGIAPIVDCEWLDLAGKEIVLALAATPIHPSISLSVLARESLVKTVQRTSGAYHTDFRLAKYIAELGVCGLEDDARVLDPACGAGILLVAVSVTACGADRKKAADWLANNVYAADLSKTALRGARLALASLTDDIDAIISMWSHWRCHDSLLAPAQYWDELVPGGFELVVGNPPWEKIKLTRHEFMQAQGADRHYGSEYSKINKKHYHQEKRNITDYAQQLNDRYSLMGSGEPDLYMAFLQLFSRLIKPGGQISVLVPAGLIRSQGTGLLRKYLFENGRSLSFTVMENREKYFSIDTRFKFLAMSFIRSEKVNSQKRNPILLHHVISSNENIVQTGTTRIGRGTLMKIRPDLSIPEVRSRSEWRIFRSMASNGVDWSSKDSNWYPEIVREVDMTRERAHFLQKHRSDALPVVEGRMVQLHRFGAKAYESGTGRRAIWSKMPMGDSKIVPQFWIKKSSLGANILERCQSQRAGFCDIAGQTNERSMTAALIPAGVVCGNKVPTIIFPNDRSENRLLLWIGIVNTIPFDWLIRRVLTTTVNYFLLLSLPFPKIEPESLAGRRLADAVRKMSELDFSGTGFDYWLMAKLRANADLSVLVAYGLGYEDLELMLRDFPLLDRGQPAIDGEDKSTITRDYLLLHAAKRFQRTTKDLEMRVAAAQQVGAQPYVPSELVAAGSANRKRIKVK